MTLRSGIGRPRSWSPKGHKVGAENLRKAHQKGGDALAITRQSVEDNDQTAPVRRRTLINNSTVEKLGEVLAENLKGLLVCRDERLLVVDGSRLTGNRSRLLPRILERQRPLHL